MRPLVVLAVSACWLGATLLFAGAVAPAAFAVLPSPALAGALVARVLPVLFIAGLVGAGIVLGLEWAAPAGSSKAVPVAGACVWGAACGVAQFAVMARITRVRAQVGGAIDALAVDDPRRVAFGRLHGASVALLAVAMLATLLLVIVCGAAARPRGSISAAPTTINRN